MSKVGFVFSIESLLKEKPKKSEWHAMGAAYVQLWTVIG